MTLPLDLPARILLLGSGELGKELTISLQRLGCHIIAVDSYPHAPAMQVADEAVVIDMADADALAAVVDTYEVDLVVPEVEAIATEVLLQLEQRGACRVVPNAHSVMATMDRQRIRAIAAQLPGVKTSAFRFASSADELREALEVTGLPAYIKPTMSSSGHGQSRITDISQAQAAWDYAITEARAHTGRVIVEEEIVFDAEITLLTLRWWDAETCQVRTSFCAPIGHRQSDGDYVESWQPAAISAAALTACEAMAKEVTTALAQAGASPCLGLFGVEFFIRGDQVYFSELSPRPHDTGMVTMVTQQYSEFDLHAHAILGLPVDTRMVRSGASAVIKSTEAMPQARYRGIAEAMAAGAQVRIFGKPVSRGGRRLGVVLAGGDTCDQARELAWRCAHNVSIVSAPTDQG
ncbi:formate-dependent phosphoribosylglycinamide formyltransferase [Schaalia suimastitidis]|uniref:formate-dependent phosphoribosylglycinamide formyltransferase n=1 Tax=Schaalia suimastitidis TaxID=121163 RepID=UPI00040CBC13|nr:formate-dependent phosphoribosylglycinamide formyltransferase [Schaalia suimastitidis]